MGHGRYSYDAHEALLRDRADGAEQVFGQERCHPLMNPKGVRVRECRDSADHPNSMGIVFALDVTGSMGDIPRMLATRQLPGFMKLLLDCGVPDPQLLFMAIGDAVSDEAPLQVGQFESTAELMDQWLTRTWIEGGGGGTNHESYELGLYFLAQHTELDSMVKRGKKGYLFMTGDEHPYEVLSRHIVDGVIGDRLDDDLEVEEILAELQKTYVPFFVIPGADRRQQCESSWNRLLGDHVLCLDEPGDICFVTAGAILLNERLVTGPAELGPILEKAGLAPARTAKVIHTLVPFAATLGMGEPTVLSQLSSMFKNLVGK